MVVMIARARMLNVTTPLEVLIAIVEMATDTMGHTVTVWTKIMLHAKSNVTVSSLDIDECAEDTHTCHVMSNATCSDTDGSFYCNCTEGFEGNGTYCKGTAFPFICFA